MPSETTPLDRVQATRVRFTQSITELRATREQQQALVRQSQRLCAKSRQLCDLSSALCDESWELLRRVRASLDR